MVRAVGWDEKKENPSVEDYMASVVQNDVPPTPKPHVWRPA